MDNVSASKSDTDSQLEGTDIINSLRSICFFSLLCDAFQIKGPNGLKTHLLLFPSHNSMEANCLFYTAWKASWLIMDCQAQKQFHNSRKKSFLLKEIKIIIHVTATSNKRHLVSVNRWFQNPTRGNIDYNIF